MLVVRLEGGRRALAEDRRVLVGFGVGLGLVARPVVLDLVVVPDEGERVGLVGGDEVGVEAVQGVAVAVLHEVHRLGPQLGGDGDVAHASHGVDGVLVDVVAQVQDQIDVLLGEVPVGGVEALEPRLAGDEGEVQLPGAAVRRGRGAGAADRAEHSARAEAVVVVPVRLESGDLHVDGVGELGHRAGPSPAYDGPEAVVAGDLPLHVDGVRRHAAAAVGREGLGGETGPQYDPVRPRVAGRHAEGERVLVEGRVAPGPARGQAGRGQGHADRAAEHHPSSEASGTT